MCKTRIAHARATSERLKSTLHREITALEQKLLSSEETIQKLLNVIQKKDDLIVQLKHRSHLLTKICRSRPILDNLLSYMAEGEKLSTFPETHSDSSSPIHDEFQESNCITNQISKINDFSLSEDDLEDQKLDISQFGTTV
nr:vimentin-type intermediate filament-associated coiled-coil protein isoform X2 [Pelodiscus sinensis]XP_025042302.1 vimentin-type intermediate filament-associated coiled-coil protein isoform X2 [Pelodiscus sinensis]|eukprot:XP_006126889.1 vimentin-type intermediate filament-associated coiled-coil protein isoform X2 [Pelodiscus sinensis]